jgi:hypothetical protein
LHIKFIPSFRRLTKFEVTPDFSPLGHNNWAFLRHRFLKVKTKKLPFMPSTNQFIFKTKADEKKCLLIQSLCL